MILGLKVKKCTKIKKNYNITNENKKKYIKNIQKKNINKIKNNIEDNY